jgi:hypothetical protein
MRRRGRLQCAGLSRSGRGGGAAVVNDQANDADVQGLDHAVAAMAVAAMAVAAKLAAAKAGEGLTPSPCAPLPVGVAAGAGDGALGDGRGGLRRCPARFA